MISLPMPSTQSIAQYMRALNAALIMTLCLPSQAQQQREWPRLPTPEHSDFFEVGSQTKLNGVPVRIQGFVSDRSIPELNQWFRQKVGGQWVENKIGNKTVLGQRQGDFFVTLELEAMHGGRSGQSTKVVTGIMDLRRPATRPTAGLDAVGDWAARLPLNSKVTSHLTDNSGTHESLHLVAVNGQSLEFNVQHFQREFRQMGYRQEISVTDDGGRPKPRFEAAPTLEKLSFSSPKTDAVVVLGRDDAGRSTMVLIINKSKQ